MSRSSSAGAYFSTSIDPYRPARILAQPTGGRPPGRDLGFVNPALYWIGRSAYYHQAFHDVTTGTNTVKFPTQTVTGYQAAPGWDPVTGWGSPDAQVLVPLLARHVSP